MCFWAVQNLARVSNEVSNDDLGTHVAAEAAAKSTTFVLWYGAIINKGPPGGLQGASRGPPGGLQGASREMEGTCTTYHKKA